jgi:hypothetical protein
MVLESYVEIYHGQKTKETKKTTIAEAINMDGERIKELEGKTFVARIDIETIERVDIPQNVLEELREYGVVLGAGQTRVTLVPRS